MKYNYKYGILFKFNPIMDLIINKPFGYMILLSLFNENSRDFKEGDKINFTYNKGNNKKLLNWYNKINKF